MDNFSEKCKLYAFTLASLSNLEKENWNSVFAQKFIHYSTAIEGNTCTQSEVTIIMQDGLLPADKLLEEVEEIKYHQKAWNFAKSQYANLSLNESIIKSIHKKILYYDEDCLPGEYRKVNIIIRNAEHHPPKAHHIDSFLQEYYAKLQEPWQNPIKKAAYAHAELSKIHPFTDGNGRTSRIVMNYILLQANLPPIAITKTGKAKYFDTLAIYDETGNTIPLECLIKKCIEKELELFFDLYAERMPINKLNDIKLSLCAKELLSKYNQLEKQHNIGEF